MNLELSHVKQLLAEYVLENYALKLRLVQLEEAAKVPSVPLVPPPVTL
jgi:hypothetical protein